MKFKKKTIAVIGLAAGTVMLAGAALASYSTMSGYEVGKTALKGLLSNENYTSDLTMSLSVDGVNIDTYHVTESYDRDGEVVLNRISENTSIDSENNHKNYVYLQDDTEIHVHESEKKSYTDVHSDNFSSYGAYTYLASFDELSGMNDDDKQTVNKVIRFAELMCDTITGDLKNNFVYVSGDDYSSTYEISLDAIQIPEFVNAGLSAVFSSVNQYDYETNPFTDMGTDPIVKSASLVFTVNNEGRLTDGKANAILIGEGHEAAIDISLKMSDYGTTVPERVDISTLPNVTHFDY